MQDILQNLPALISPIGLVVVFLLLHLVTGFAASSRPFLWSIAEGASDEIDRRLNKTGKSPSDLALRGTIVTFFMAFFGFVVGYAVHKFSNHSFGWLAQIVLLFATVGHMGALGILRRVQALLTQGKEEAARAALQPYVHDNLEQADVHTLARRALEFSAVRLNLYFVAPLFFFLLIGPVGLGIYVMLAGFARSCARIDARHMMFGGIARGLIYVADFIPARLTALLIVLAALFVSKSNPFRSFATALAQARKYGDTNNGWLVAAMAGGLGVTLGGPYRHRRGHTLEYGWVGPKSSSAKLEVQDIQRGAMLHFVVLPLGLILLSGIFVLGFYYS